jgi:hypothetical protein
MAMMIPSFIDPDTAPGEVDVYNMLANGPDDWVVFHQVDLTSTIRGSVKSRREIDFLIVIPKAGIMCIEVKSHEGIHFDGKNWHPSTIKQDPFKQSLNALKALERHLQSQGATLDSIPLGRCCIFPRSSFSLDSENAIVGRWELFDMRAFRGFRDSSVFCAALEDSLRKSIDREYGRQLATPLSSSQISRLKSYLAPIQKYRPSEREQIRAREEMAFSLLREQQKPIVKFAESATSTGELHNPRLIIDGAAGTGKSWIAMEIARRMADSGKRTGLVCFNKLVGEWIAVNISKDVGRPNLIAGPAIRMLIDMTGVPVPASPDESFWESDIYDAIEEKLTDPEFNDDVAFDYLIIDEAQDVLSKPRLFQSLMQLVPGGVEGGSYSLVGDFKYQLFGNRADLEGVLAEVRSKAKGIPTYPLYENCRNYSIVGGSAVKLSGIRDKVYEGFMRSGGSMTNFNLNFYPDRLSQLNLLAETIKKSKALGYDNSDIVILSLVNDDLCIARDLQKLSYKISSAKQPLPNTLRYCTVNSFKGLEAKVVIVTDIEAEENEFKRNQLYTSLTRATESVHVLFSESSRNLVAKWIF